MTNKLRVNSLDDIFIGKLQKLFCTKFYMSDWAFHFAVKRRRLEKVGVARRFHVRHLTIRATFLAQPKIFHMRRFPTTSDNFLGFMDYRKKIEISGCIFFVSRIRGIVSDLRSDESFTVKTGSYRKIMVDPSIEPVMSKWKSDNFCPM